MQSIPDDARAALADPEAALAAQPETAAKIDAFLTNPETGIVMARPVSETEHVISALQDAGYYTEEVGSAADNGIIVNLLRDGEYLVTLTITRTPGY